MPMNSVCQYAESETGCGGGSHTQIWFLQRYVKWTYHSEVDMPPLVDDRALVTDEMIDIINDVIGEQDTNEECINEGISDGGGNSAENQFDDLFQEVGVELYPGCT